MMQKESAFFSTSSPKISLNQSSPKLSQVRTKNINPTGSPLTKFVSPQNSQQGSPAQGLSPGLKTPKNQIEGSPTLIKAKSNLMNLKLTVFQDASLLSPFLQTEASSSRSLTGTTNLESIESNQNSSAYNPSVGSEVASSENLRASKWRGNQDKLLKTQIIQLKNEVPALSSKQKSLNSKEMNGIEAKAKLTKMVNSPSPKIESGKFLTKKLSNVKSGVSTPTKNFCLPSPKINPLSTTKATFFGRRDLSYLAETSNNTPRRPDDVNAKSAFARPLSARNNLIASCENAEAKEEQPVEEVPEKSDNQYGLLKKRASRIMTKELEAKYGIKMVESDDSSLTSEQSVGDAQEGKSPSEETKISQLAELESVCFDALEENKNESKIRNFLIKRQEVKSLRNSKRVNSLAPNNALQEKQPAQGKKVKTMIVNDDYWGTKNGKIQTGEAKNQEDLFVGGNSDYFQLNTANLRYSDYVNYYQDDVAALQQKSGRKEKDWGERKLPLDEYKPMVVWFATGGRIIQPKYMRKMGSMCYTEFWPKNMSMKIQKMVVKEGDCVKLSNTERNYETVYRPVKWNHEDGVKKRVDVNVQAMKGGHEREIGMAKEKNKMRDEIRAKKNKK